QRMPVALTLRPLSDSFVSDKAKFGLTTTLFNYLLNEWKGVMLYLKAHSDKTFWFPGNYRVDVVLEALNQRYLSKICPKIDEMWYPRMHAALYRDAAWVLEMRNDGI